jgi:hypothetical protein
MTKRPYLFGITLTLTLVLFSASAQYPIMDRIAAKVIQKYQTSSCEQLYASKANKQPPGPEEQKLIQLLKGDQQMRAAFLSKVAPPIADKMLECGMIP